MAKNGNQDFQSTTSRQVILEMILESKIRKLHPPLHPPDIQNEIRTLHPPLHPPNMYNELRSQ